MQTPINIRNAGAYHIPVMLREAIGCLEVRPGGVYVDATFGGGGHSTEILKLIGPDGRLVAFDQDADAAKNAPDDDRLELVRGNFRFLNNYLDYLGVDKIDGLLADLGVSSHHFDEAGRGFSFRYDTKLDMRMSQDTPNTAADLINTYSAEQLANVFSQYGEVAEAHRLTNVICERRRQSPILTTGDLREIVERTCGKHNAIKTLPQVFQALRIEVNREMEALEQLLTQAQDRLRPGGILAVIAYHSLEDRMVKNLIRSGNPNKPNPVTDEIYGGTTAPLKAINKKAICPSQQEVARNPRARSAKLRAAVKTQKLKLI